MSLSQIQLLEIAKKIVIFSAAKKKLAPTEAKKVLGELKKVEASLENDSSPLGKKVKTFLRDVIEDIESGREINIDGIQQDEYIENFLTAHIIVQHYNALLKKSDYLLARSHLWSQNMSAFQKLVNEMQKSFKTHFKKVSSGEFAKYLLIIWEFKLAKPRKYFQILYHEALAVWDLESGKIFLDILQELSVLKYETKISALQELKKGKIIHNYLVCNIEKNRLAFHSVNLAKDENVENLYRKHLMNI
jgi:hypothetical protein